MISLILARADDGVIGRKGALPWHLPADMRRFKALSWGKPCLMGRKTWESLPAKFRPLPGRTNIVVSANPNFTAPGARVVASLEAALACAGDAPETMVIGGATLYRTILSLADRVYLTEVHISVPDGDTVFAALPATHWRQTAREDGASADGLAYSFVTLDRIRA